MTITEEMIRAQSKQSSRILVEEVTSLHDRIAEQFDDVLNGRKVIAEWMTLGQKNVVFKDPGNGVDNYRPIYHVYPLCGLCRQVGWSRKARTTS